VTAARSDKDVDLFSTPGPDRDNAQTMYAQARNGLNPLDAVQVLHLLRIGYTAGRRATESDQSFDWADARYSVRSALCFGLIAGLLVATLLFLLVR
jgi:hypothetical protein